MSQSPFTVTRAEDGKVSMEKPIDSMMNDGLIDPFNGMVMAQTGNRIAELFGITRERLIYSLLSRTSEPIMLTKRAASRSIMLLWNMKTEF